MRFIPQQHLQKPICGLLFLHLGDITDLGPVFSIQQLGTHPIQHQAHNRRSERGNWLSDDSIDSEGSKRPARVWSKTDGSWLDLHSDQEEGVHTRAGTISVADRRPSLGEKDNLYTLQGDHQVQGTVGPADEEKSGQSAMTKGPELDSATTTMIDREASDSMADRFPVLQFTTGKRPLQEAAAGESSSHQSEIPGSGSHRRVSSVTSTLSSQKSKKRLTWRRKACIVSVPLNDERGKRPLLSAAEVEVRIRKWRDRDLDVRGFRLGSSVGEEESNAQTCGLYPDPISLTEDRSQRGIVVGVPDHADWDHYVYTLKEEKLRALGVSSHESDGQESNQSPIPSMASRAPSQGPRKPVTPPVLPSSAATGAAAPNGRPFSLASHTSNGTSAVNLAASFHPQRPHSQPGLRRAEQSVAYATTHPRKSSPLDQPPSHSLSPFQPQHQHPSHYAQSSNGFPPAGFASLQGLGQVFPAMSPLLGPIGAAHSNIVPDHLGQHRKSPLQLAPYQPHQQSRPHRALSDHLSSSSIAYGERDIAHPAPQGHQHNIGKALQSEIDVAATEAKTAADFDLRHVTATKASAMEQSGQSTLSSLQQGSHRSGQAEKADPAGLPPEIDLPVLQPASGESLVLTTDAHQPSMAHTPKSTDVKDPDSCDHNAAFSASKLNVEAEEFKVVQRSEISMSNPTINQNALQPLFSGDTPIYGSMSSSQPVQPWSKATSGLNADAPSFTPSAAFKDIFQFHSPSFNVDAPVFNPSQMVSKHPTGEGSTADSAVAGDRIFSDVTLDAAGKTSRRSKGSKALPTRHVNVEEPTEDDEDGRVRASTARQKRARVRNDHHDDLARYDSSLPSQIGILQSTGGAPTSVSLQELPNGSNIDTAVTVNETVFASVADKEDESKPESVPQDELYTSIDEKKASATSPTEPQPSARREMSKERLRALHFSNHVSALASSPLPLGAGTVDGLFDSLFPASKSQNPPGSEVPPDAAHASLSPSTATICADSPDERLAAAFSISSATGEPVEVGKGTAGQEGFPEDTVETACDYTGQNIDAEDAAHELPSLVHRSCGNSASAGDEKDEQVPSYAEIDAVMKQLEDNSDLGVERVDTSLTPPSQAGVFLNPSITIRSDAYSPAPGRAQADLESVHGTQDDRPPSERQTLSMSSVSRLSGMSHVEGHDRDNSHSTADERRPPSRTLSADSHVNRVIEGTLENRLAPLEKALHTIQTSISILASQDPWHQQRSSPSNAGHSDADDEDDDGDTKAGDASGPQIRSPLQSRKDRKGETIKTAVAEALAAYKLGTSSSSEVEHSGIERLLNEVKSIKEAAASREPKDIKAIIEDVISTHPRLRGKRALQDHGAGSSDKLKLQIDGLESMLKIANERAEDEYRARREIEDDLAETDRRLNLMAEEAAQYREAAEEAEESLCAYHEEKESDQDLEQTNSELSLKNAALETTLEEYRLSRDQWHIDIKDERQRNHDLKAILRSLRHDIEENSQTKHSLRAKIDRLQGDLTTVVDGVAYDKAASAQREHELSAKNKELEAAVLRETHMCERFEVDLEERERENTRLAALLTQSREESRMQEDAAHRLQREVYQIGEAGETESSKMRSTHEHEVALLKNHHSAVYANLDSQISCLQAQLQQTVKDTDSMQTRHQDLLSDEVERHNRALHQVRESRDDALGEQRRSHEKTLNDLRERHARALHNASDDKHRLEAHVSEKLALSTDKIQHLEGKVTDLQDRVEVTSTAARAAADFAKSGDGVAPPKMSPMASFASMPLVKGSNIPEKISAQALRESIIVLQDQLQHREQNIESLETELAKVDRDAPAKIKHRDTEITWLRELLGVRIDDLEEIIETLARPEFDREAVKDAIIRLKANLQMEQQERERVATGAFGGFPSISSLTSLAQSPRALPMAAAAALGSWRRGRDGSLGTHLERTPSRSRTNPQSFLSGLLTPPRTNQRQSTPTGSAPPTMRALNGRNLYSDARPLRGHSGPVRSMSARQAAKGPALSSSAPQTHPQTQQNQQHQRQQQPAVPSAPSTPPLLSNPGSDTDIDADADTRRSILGDLDDDASLVGSELDCGDGRAGPLSLSPPGLFSEAAPAPTQ